MPCDNDIDLNVLFEYNYYVIVVKSILLVSYLLGRKYV